jgi:hypothetical protein
VEKGKDKESKKTAQTGFRKKNISFSAFVNLQANMS